jgi:hypothetical protein
MPGPFRRLSALNGMKPAVTMPSMNALMPAAPLFPRHPRKEPRLFGPSSGLPEITPAARQAEPESAPPAAGFPRSRHVSPRTALKA